MIDEVYEQVRKEQLNQLSQKRFNKFIRRCSIGGSKRLQSHEIDNYKHSDSTNDVIDRLFHKSKI